MNVYWAGGEDVDFTMVGAQTQSTSTPWSFDTAWARCWIGTATSSTTWPLTSSISNPASFGNLSSFWLHVQVGMGAVTTTLNAILLALADNAGVARILVRGTGTNGQLKISTRNAAGTITDLVTSASALWPATTLHKLDLFINYAVSGQATLYLDGAAVADTGPGVNVTTDSATSLSYVYLATAASGQFFCCSQVIVADSDTRSAQLWLMNSSVAGNAQTWTGTASNVNKLLINDTTFVAAASAGLIEEFKTGGIALPTGTYSVAAVVMSSRALGGSAGGPTRVEYVTRVGSTDYVGGIWTPPAGSFANNANYIQATNPGTGSSWTPSDLTAATFNYGVESVA